MSRNSTGIEPLGRLLADGLEDLALQHWEEVEEPVTGAPLKVDWDRLMMLERQEAFVSFAARTDKRLVGYAGFFVGPSFYAAERHATGDVIFVEKDLRGSGVGLQLVLHAESHFFGSGIASIAYHVKLAPVLRSTSKSATVGDLLLRLGYEAVGAVHAKRCGASNVRRRR